jgi:hypothetical protein
MSRAGEARERLKDFGIDELCEMITDGTTLTDIGKSRGVSFARLQAWITSQPEFPARVKEAREQAAKLWDELAVTGIQAATDPFQLNKAKEIAYHYRWRASKIAPREYGDKLELSGGLELTALTDEQLDLQIAKALAKAKITTDGAE